LRYSLGRTASDSDKINAVLQNGEIMKLINSNPEIIKILSENLQHLNSSFRSEMPLAMNNGIDLNSLGSNYFEAIDDVHLIFTTLIEYMDHDSNHYKSLQCKLKSLGCSVRFMKNMETENCKSLCECP